MTETATTSKKSPLDPIYSGLKTMEIKIGMFKKALGEVPNANARPEEFMDAYQSMVCGFISDLKCQIESINEDELSVCKNAVARLEEKIADLEKQVTANTTGKPGAMIPEHMSTIPSIDRKKTGSSLFMLDVIKHEVELFLETFGFAGVTDDQEALNHALTTVTQRFLEGLLSDIESAKFEFYQHEHCSIKHEEVNP